MIKAIRILSSFLLLITVSVPAMRAQPAVPAAPDASSLTWLVGGWRGAGTMMNNPSEATLEIRPALGGHFLELRLRMGPGFEGRAFYRALGGARWSGQWMDSRGSSFGTGGVVESRVFTADWGSDEAGRGRSVYRLLGDGRLEVTDSIVRRDGSVNEFARHVLRREQ